ncbi:hypothetical protein PAPYR_514 [Paratrimastix pyriformis]|uniref:Uncharacterized protein n=1 Tax=Paratrimastix pyriformis TaxID=342808 RepID=A0ABQ8UXP3_9EUKA|nr:hypothetical protein PAPYR_514 [Paratrimastix pyriformis]
MQPRERDKRRKSSHHISQQVGASSRDPDQSRTSIRMEAPIALGEPFVFPPPDLMPNFVATSADPLRTYVQLLGLSHAIRLAVRGTPRKLSFDEDPRFRSEMPTPTADAVAALVGPCKGLTTLAFRFDGKTPVYGCGLTEAAYAGWVDEAFGGHDRLAVLDYLPTFYEPAIERILGHLPGLVELRLGTRPKTISAHLLAALVRSCPHLKVLQGASKQLAQLDTALAPLAGSLQEFRLPCLRPSANLDAFVPLLSALETLVIGHCRPASLEPIVAHLTHFGMALPDYEFLGCITPAGLARLLAAHPAMMQRLQLVLKAPNADGLADLKAALDGLPRLTHLDLTYHFVQHRAADPLDLPHGLLGRLEDLTLRAHDSLVPEVAPRPLLSITSSRLAHLNLQVNSVVTALVLDCPALVELRLPKMAADGQLTLNCPRLRELENVPLWYAGSRSTPPMPSLESVGFAGGNPVWLPDLLASSPRLQCLGVVLARQDLLSCLCSCDTLCCALTTEPRRSTLRLYLGVLAHPTLFPDPRIVLRFPERLETLWLTFVAPSSSESGEGGVGPLDLRVEAPGLRRFEIVHSDHLDLRIRLDCPALTALSLEIRPSQITSLKLVNSRTQLQTLTINGRCKSASLLDLLDRHHHLRAVRLASVSAHVWARLVTALGKLPRLVRLAMDVSNAPSPILLTCPQLRALELMETEDRDVVLACPLIEMIKGIPDPSGHLELTVPAPNLPLDKRRALSPNRRSDHSRWVASGESA